MVALNDLDRFHLVEDVVDRVRGLGSGMAHAAPIRARLCEDARWLGVRLDPAANRRGGRRISAPGSRVPVWVVPTNEELMIARHTYDVLGRNAGGA